MREEGEHREGCHGRLVAWPRAIRLLLQLEPAQGAQHSFLGAGIAPVVFLQDLLAFASLAGEEAGDDGDRSPDAHRRTRWWRRLRAPWLRRTGWRRHRIQGGGAARRGRFQGWRERLRRVDIDQGCVGRRSLLDGDDGHRFLDRAGAHQQAQEENAGEGQQQGRKRSHLALQFRARLPVLAAVARLSEPPEHQPQPLPVAFFGQARHHLEKLDIGPRG